MFRPRSSWPECLVLRHVVQLDVCSTCKLSAQGVSFGLPLHPGPGGASGRPCQLMTAGTRAHHPAPMSCPGGQSLHGLRLSPTALSPTARLRDPVTALAAAHPGLHPRARASLQDAAVSRGRLVTVPSRHSALAPEGLEGV